LLTAGGCQPTTDFLKNSHQFAAVSHQHKLAAAGLQLKTGGRPARFDSSSGSPFRYRGARIPDRLKL
jgi:hypothetical protein